MLRQDSGSVSELDREACFEALVIIIPSHVHVTALILLTFQTRLCSFEHHRDPKMDESRRGTGPWKGKVTEEAVQA